MHMFHDALVSFAERRVIYMDIEDIVIEDLFSFFMSFNNKEMNNELKSINSLIPYLAFLVVSNERAYNFLQDKMLGWDYRMYSNEFNKCPWINCKFVTRMIDLEKEKRIMQCLLYLNSETTDDNDIYQVLSAGWKRIALFVENDDIIDLKNAPLRKKVEEKWALCILVYIKNKNIVQAKDKKEWYNFSSELFFYYEYIIQLMDTDILQDVLLIKKATLNNEELFLDIDENQDLGNEGELLFQTSLLILEKERILRKSILKQEVKNEKSNNSEVKKEKKIEDTRDNAEIEHELDSVFRKLEHYKKINSELEKKVRILSDENVQLKKTNDILNEEIRLFGTHDEEDEILVEDKCAWEYLAKKRIVICGGRLEWQNRIKQMFPQWKYIENDDIRFDGQLLKDIDLDVVVFNKRFVSHGLFYRVASQKNNNVPLLCINSSNVESSLQIICSKLKNLEL